MPACTVLMRDSEETFEVLLKVRSRISSQSSCSDLHQIWSRTIERNRRRSQVYVEDFAIEERPKMVVKMSARM